MADVLEIARQLSERGERFAMATVLWRRGPSSGKTGYRAVITSAGEVRGWVGGACAEPIVVREALTALDEGTPRTIFIGRPEELAGEERDGTIAVPISCQSEGALKIFIEPVPRGPDLVVIGRSPMVHTLAAMAGTLGWWTTVVDDGGHPEDWTEPDRLVTELDLTKIGAGPRTALVVATQGHYDEDALEQAVTTTGLNLGHVSHEEIAVAILAELVQFRAAGGLKRTATTDAPAVGAEAIDPVCGMTVQVAGARYHLERDGQTWYFCCAGCLNSFEARQEETGHGDPSGERVHSPSLH